MTEVFVHIFQLDIRPFDVRQRWDGRRRVRGFQGAFPGEWPLSDWWPGPARGRHRCQHPNGTAGAGLELRGQGGGAVLQACLVHEDLEAGPGAGHCWRLPVDFCCGWPRPPGQHPQWWALRGWGGQGVRMFWFQGIESWGEMVGGRGWEVGGGGGGGWRGDKCCHNFLLGHRILEQNRIEQFCWHNSFQCYSLTHGLFHVNLLDVVLTIEKKVYACSGK